MNQGCWLIEVPFVERDFDDAPANEHADAKHQRQHEHIRVRQRQVGSVTLGKQVDLEEAQGVAQAIPPEVKTSEVRDDRVDPVDIWSQHCEPTDPQITAVAALREALRLSA